MNKRQGILPQTVRLFRGVFLAFGSPPCVSVNSGCSVYGFSRSIPERPDYADFTDWHGKDKDLFFRHEKSMFFSVFERVTDEIAIAA
jgi:hypothetical protein